MGAFAFMGIFDRFKTQTTTQKPPPARRNWQVLEAISLGNNTASGVAVNPDNALNLSTVWSCVRVVALAMAKLPLDVYERRDDGRYPAPKHPLFSLLKYSPNPLMTSFNYRMAMMAHLMLWGNHYSKIQYGNDGQVQSLIPLLPGKMEPVRVSDDKMVYRYTMPNAEQVVWPGEQVWHLSGISLDGIVGYRPIDKLRESVGLARAAQDFGSRFFDNDARPGGVLQHPGVLSDEAYDRLVSSWESRHGGLSKSHKVAVLEEGMEFEEIGIPPEDAQFLETRKFEANVIAGAFGVPPHMIGLLENATFSNIEHQAIQFKEDTIDPQARNIEQSIWLNLLLERDRGRYYAEFNTNALLRADTVSKWDSYTKSLSNGVLSINEVREKENLNPIEGGDQHFIQVNMAPIDMLGEIQDPEPPPPDTARAVRSLPDIEERARATAAKRHRLIADYLPLFKDVLGRIVRREAADVKRLAKKYLGKDDLAGFIIWLDEFYSGDHREFVDKNMLPAYKAYAASVARAVAAEADSDDDIDADAFVDSYNELYAGRYTGRQRKALGDLIAREQAGDDLLGAIDSQMDEWDETRPDLEARRETHRANNAIALFAMGALGISTKRWVTIGDSCPYCTQLNGRTISTTQYFLQTGESLAGGERGPLTVSNNIGHPPAHDGCDCMVIVG